MKQKIMVKSQFIGFHHWPQAPDDVAFLRKLHRHVFHVILHIPTSEDRQLEFFQVQRQLKEILMDFYDEQDLGSASCEMLAAAIGGALADRDIICSKVEVWEDMENGAVVYQDLAEPIDWIPEAAITFGSDNPGDF